MGTRPAVEEDPNAAVVCSSPPCFMHELDPAYLGYLGRGEVAALVGELLAADWGGAAPDEERLRAALRRHVGATETAPGASAAEPACRGPAKIPAVREALPRIHDDALRRDLELVLDALERGGA
ncbi:MAG: hypothetical protein ICV73_26745 [Acetobacteraceae bacterium]|nr:hypothetical protein [Acetobacteraceae bacterium]